MADRLSQLMSEIQALLNGDEPEPEDMQVIYEEELLRYNPANFGEAIPPEAMEIISGMVDPGGKVKGIASMLDDLFDIMKRGKTMGKTSVKRSKESEEYWDDASKRSRSDRIARENIDESRRLLEETPTPPSIRIPRQFNPKMKRYEDIDPTEKPPLKFKGGGHLYRKGYYGRSYK